MSVDCPASPTRVPRTSPRRGTVLRSVFVAAALAFSSGLTPLPVVDGTALPAEAATSTAALQVSGRSDRSGAVALAGATLTGDSRVFLPHTRTARRVDFSLDGSSAVLATRRSWPFDLAGIDPAGAPLPLRTLALAPGPHTLRATITWPTGRTTRSAGFVVAPDQPTGAPDSPVGAVFAPGTGRPFSPASAYNTPVPADPVIDPASAAMTAVIARTGRGYANLYDFGEPVFDAAPDSPSYLVDCTEPWGTCDMEARPIRIPVEARPNAGSDGRMIIVDFEARSVCDFWQARRTPTGWATSWGTCASIDGDGRGPQGGATGAGVNALTGVVRTYEMRAGRIDHALSFGTDNSCQRVFRHPAVKTDGSSARADCIPEGARLQLDPAVDVDAIPGITPGERAVAKALQVYGAYNRDNAGAPMAFQFEAPFGEPDPYPAAGFAWDYYDMPHIPWHRVRVLRSWDGR